ncbi:MAG: hypothetical protein OEZ29_04035 [Candidatus Bathyarchaeota archaeon]|nr:hypothetical protein [Candidatus Bathyarchaeota archaeon]
MRINQTNYPVIPISEKALLAKIDKIAKDCSRLDQYPMTLFKDHVKEIKREVETRLSDSASTTDPILRKQYYLFSWLSIWLLSDQLEKFTLVEASTNDPMWSHLNIVIDDLVHRLGLSSKPLPFFGSSFYCTGSFAYTERGIPVSPFYQVSTESQESILFWPLLAHEIAHLKLHETDEVQNLRRELSRHNLRSEKYRERLDEALCDIIATVLYGPAYIAAFGTKFWQILDEYHDESYPSNQFRLFVMFKTIKDEDLGHLFNSIRNNFEVNERLARREKISFLTDEMIEFGENLVRNPVDVDGTRIIDFCSDPDRIDKRRLDYLFNTLWLMIYQGTKTFDAATNMAESLLERWTKRC